MIELQAMTQEELQETEEYEEMWEAFIDVAVNPKIDVNIGREIPYHVPTINELGLSNNLTNGV